jgi:muramoyltetrapeptide carboxypeptidase
VSEQTYIAPPWLKKGDKIGVVSMASLLDKPRLLSGKKHIEEKFKLEVILGKNILHKHHNFAGTDEQRLADFQGMLDNPEIKAIIAGRGGYGSSRIIDAVDWTGFKANPKWIIGFSDITAVHQKIQSIGYQSIHGPMVVTLTKDKKSTRSLHDALFGKPLIYKETIHKLNREGNGEGPIIGGNLCLLAHNIGSDADFSFDGKILFLEDISEYLYNIDRMMVQLKRAGKLNKLAGLVVGQFSDTKENSTKFGKSAFEIIKEHTEGFNYPITFNFPIGHDNKNRAVRCGEVMQLKVSNDKVTLISK